MKERERERERNTTDSRRSELWVGVGDVHNGKPDTCSYTASSEETMDCWARGPPYINGYTSCP